MWGDVWGRYMAMWVSVLGCGEEVKLDVGKGVGGGMGVWGSVLGCEGKGRCWERCGPVIWWCGGKCVERCGEVRWSVGEDVGK